MCFYRQDSIAIGIEENGAIVAGIIFEGWNQKSITCHWAIEGRISREFLWVSCHYAFVQCGAYKMIAPVYSDNRRMMAMAAKMGFVEEGRLVDTQPGGDTVLFTLTADRCRFLSRRYEKNNTTARP